MKKFVLNILFFIIVLRIYSQSEVSVNFQQKFQTIDGFGAFQGGSMTTQPWWQALYIDDLECSIYRVDLTPILKSPYSDLSCYSPWFMGSQTKSVFNLEDPSNPNGPENNRVRTYTGPQDYSRTFGGRNAPIAVMGPNIETNINYFNYPIDSAISKMLQKKSQLGDVKIIGSIWSPLPWLKVSSGNSYNQNWWPGPIAGSKWPFIWGGSFAGGRLDVSGTKYNVFNDLSLGGSGNTDAITQFARSSAAYILGYQRFFRFKFYALSIQNELNFEEYYNSMNYPLSAQYLTALKALRSEFNKYPELKDIRIMGPEDLLGGDSYGMWEYGGPTHKNLQYLSNIAKDPEAMAALDFVCIHGYANDGVSSAGSNANLWDWWANGWNASPAAGIPANVKGFKSLNKKSWMTETSGENREWLFPKNAYPNNGAWSIALKIHQALTTGMESAWLYWTFVDSNDDGTVSDFGLTNQQTGVQSPKYIAAKHFFKFIRPNSYRIPATSDPLQNILSSAYYHDSTEILTVELINTSATTKNIILHVSARNTLVPLKEITSSENDYFKENSINIVNGNTSISMPGYSVKTITGIVSRIIADTKNVVEKHFKVYYTNRDCYLDISKIKDQKAFFQICNLSGQIIQQENLFARENNSAVKLNEPSMLDGIYLLKVFANQTCSIEKIIIAK